MRNPHRTARRAPGADDLCRGGRRLLQLFDGLSEQNMTGVRLEVKDDRPDMVMYSAHGIPVDGWGWQTMDVVGAMVFLYNLNRAPGARSLAFTACEEQFIIDERWGLLPPVIDALHCILSLRPDALSRAEMRVLNRDAVRSLKTPEVSR